MDFLTNLISGNGLLYGLIVLPVVFALISLLLPGKCDALRRTLYVFAGAVNLLFSVAAALCEGAACRLSFCGIIEMSLSADAFSRFIILFLGILIAMNALFGFGFMKNLSYTRNFTALILISVAMANGSVLADNLIAMLFFWEGFMATLLGLLLIGNTHDPKTAVKCLTLNAVSDLMLMLGIAITVHLAGTANIAYIHALPIKGLGIAGFACMAAGAIGKAGGMPFHSWIPDAAKDAPTPFLPVFPGAIEKFLGLYLLVRVTKDFYAMAPGSTASIVIMSVGAVTLICAVAMALIQKDMKRLLSYHAISQVGYMILGVGSGLAVGVVGGLFHMLNNTLYKACLFMTAGSIEKSVGTTDLHYFSGLGKKMPVTMICFIIAGLSIAGVPPFNGFFSKELIFDAAIESHFVFYLIAVIGAFGTVASFLKMGHAAFFGKETLPEGRTECKESPVSMLIPMILLAAGCIVFGLWNAIPLRTWIQPLTEGGHDFSGWPHSTVMVVVSLIVLALGVANHIYGTRRTGHGLGAVDHIHYAPVLKQTYHLAENHVFDPYVWITGAFTALSIFCNTIERAVNWFYDVALSRFAAWVSDELKSASNGTIERQVLWSAFGLLALLVMAIGILVL